jgi:hypothetical protein
VLARAANAVEKIIKDPMDFLEKFINAVKTGIKNFMSNILTHLKKGLQGWLFGTLADAGIEIPEKFDLKGIIGLLMSLLGLTWNSIRTRIVNVVGEKAMSAIEKGVDFIKVILTEGLPGVWKFIAQKLTDLKDQVMGQIRDFVITKVITAGITWLISLLNPAAAFVKACKMIYDAVTWFVDNAQRLKEFVDSVLDSVESIAAGGVGKVAALIESTMSKTIPMLISGLASLLGLGGIADKIKSILEKVQEPVGKAIDWLVGKAVKYGKKFLDKLKKSKIGRAAAKVKAKAKALYTKGKAYVKKKYAAGKAWVKKKYAAGKAWVKKKYEGAKKTVTDTANAAVKYLRAQCDKLLGIAFRDKFDANDESHMLYTRSGSPEDLYMASSPSRLVEAFSDAEPSARAEITSLDRSFRGLMNEYRAKAKALRGRNPAWVVKNGKAVKAELAAIKALGRKAAAVQKNILTFARKNIKSRREGPGTHAPGIGTIAPYGAKIGSMHGKGAIKEWRMIAEHIIPDALVRRALMALTRTGKVTKEDTGYELQSTILIYAGAAREKTGGTPWDANRGADQDLINRMGNVVGMVRDRAGGFGGNLRKKSVTPARNGVEPKRYWRTYMKDQFERRIEPLLQNLSQQSLARTKAAVKTEQQLAKDRRGIDAATRPSDSELQSSYDSQKAIVDQTIKKQLANAEFD